MSRENAPQVVIVGGGPAGLMAAEILASHATVTLYEHMPSLGRKFLMAGRGGLNLTHSEPIERLLARYGGEIDERLAKAIETFPPAALRQWCEGLGQETFVGSSGRVFPKALKASPLLRAWLRRLEARGVRFASRRRWLGWDEAGSLLFETPTGAREAVRADAAVLALGGASWPRLGSDGGWVEILKREGVAISPLKPANAGFHAAWSAHFAEKFAGDPLKRIALSFAGHTVRGEALVTTYGLEGGAVYALSSALRNGIEASGEAVVAIDLRPDLDASSLAKRLEKPRGKDSLSSHLRKSVGLGPAAIGLLREGHDSALPAEREKLASAIKSVPVRLTAMRGLDRAISTAGGIPFAEIDARFMLRRKPSTFVCGEMLDWEAPTGGYLLQACFSTAVAAAHGVLYWLKREAAIRDSRSAG